ncbi:MAG: hypothetical protein ACRENZ_09955 [Thermodesulfobacteriota bacterium]
MRLLPILSLLFMVSFSNITVSHARNYKHQYKHHVYNRKHPGHYRHVYYPKYDYHGGHGYHGKYYGHRYPSHYGYYFPFYLFIPPVFSAVIYF